MEELGLRYGVQDSSGHHDQTRNGITPLSVGSNPHLCTDSAVDMSESKYTCLLHKPTYQLREIPPPLHRQSMCFSLNDHHRHSLLLSPKPLEQQVPTWRRNHTIQCSMDHLYPLPTDLVPQLLQLFRTLVMPPCSDSLTDEARAGLDKYLNVSIIWSRKNLEAKVKRGPKTRT